MTHLKGALKGFKNLNRFKQMDDYFHHKESETMQVKPPIVTQMVTIGVLFFAVLVPLTRFLGMSI